MNCLVPDPGDVIKLLPVRSIDVDRSSLLLGRSGEVWRVAGTQNGSPFLLSDNPNYSGFKRRSEQNCTPFSGNAAREWTSPSKADDDCASSLLRRWGPGHRVLLQSDNIRGSIDWQDIKQALALGQDAMQRARYRDPLISDLAKNMGWIRCFHDEAREYEGERDTEENLLELLSNEYTTARVRRTTPKVGRNEPCPCGSGQKFKKCCAPH
jgi:hypothetical protein